MVLSTSLRRLSVMAALLLGSIGCAWAQAPASSLSLVFTEPTGVVGPTDSIAVNLRFTNIDPTLDFVLDPSLPDGGLDASILPAGTYVFNPDTGGWDFVAFASYTGFDLTVGFGCSGTFTAPDQCTQGPPYTFNFAGDPFVEPFVLPAGQSMEYLFGTFTPSAGPVAAGTYEFYRSVVWLNVYGLDALGNDISAVVFPASTCQFDNANDCANASMFTRTVVAVPEPGTYALMALGLGLVGLRARRRIAAR
jgi:hypothetical protein